MQDNDIKVLGGNPSDTEMAALAAVLTQLDNAARAKAAQTATVRDMWGTPVEAGNPFNPSAFMNVRYY